jgi:hypothetical protein
MATVYEVLGLAPTNDFKQLKKAYRAKALAYHPDRGGNEAAFKDLQNAWTLIDEEAKAKSYFVQFSALAIKPDWKDSYAGSIPGSSGGPFSSSSESSFSGAARSDIPTNPTVSRMPVSKTKFVPIGGGLFGFFETPNIGGFIFRQINLSLLFNSSDPTDKALGIQLNYFWSDIDPMNSTHQFLTAFKQILTIMVDHADLSSATDNKKYFFMNQLSELVGEQVTLERYNTVLADYASKYVGAEAVARVIAHQSEPGSSVSLLN